MKVNHGKLSDNIIDKKYISPEEDWEKIKRTIGYKWLPLFDECIQGNLAQTNSDIILKILSQLNLSAEVKFDEPGVYKTPSEKLLDICKRNSATTYLSGPSGRRYLDVKEFDDAGIEVKFSEPSNLLSSRSILERLHIDYYK